MKYSTIQKQLKKELKTKVTVHKWIENKTKEESKNVILNEYVATPELEEIISKVEPFIDRVIWLDVGCRPKWISGQGNKPQDE
jgi:SAM-dependent MidA family methyltransferase